MTETIDSLLTQPWMRTALGLAVLLLASWLASVVVRRVLLGALNAFSERTTWQWDDALERRRVFRHLAQAVPMLIIQYGVVLVPGLSAMAIKWIGNSALALTVLFVLLAISAALSALEDLYQATPHGHQRSIKGYVQLLKIVLFMIGAIVIVASLINRSPLLLLSGLGAVSAVLLLIFKDTILSVVASVQLASNDMLRVGDWITMPSANVDGNVIDIALHTVKVQNFDKTISTVPTWRLISESYMNWRGMQDSGGRRIKRAIYLDATGARFLADAQIEHLSRFHLLDKYFAAKREELKDWNGNLGESGKLPVNQRRLSNLGTFRAYAQAYLDAHPHINHDFTCMVRPLDPGPTGIPMQMYCFTDTTDWAEYEGIQADIFDHLIAILPEFGLKLFQQPIGADWRNAFAVEGEPAPPRAHQAVAAEN